MQSQGTTSGKIIKAVIVFSLFILLFVSPFFTSQAQSFNKERIFNSSSYNRGFARPGRIMEGADSALGKSGMRKEFSAVQGDTQGIAQSTAVNGRRARDAFKEAIIWLISFCTLLLVSIIVILLITMRHRWYAEKEMIEKSERLNSLIELSKKISSIVSQDELLPWISQQAVKLLHTDVCNCRIREGGFLVRASGFGGGMELMKTERLRIGTSLSGIIARDKKPLVVNNAQEDERYIDEHKEVAKKLGLISFLGVPMMIGDEVKGVISVFTKKYREFDASDVTLLSSFADMAAIAIENAKLFLELEEEIIRRNKTEEELKDAHAKLEKRLDLAVYGADIGMWDWNVQTGDIVYSENWGKILGYTPHEIENHYKSWERLLHPDDVADTMKALNDNLEGKTDFYEKEYRMKSKDGSWKWVLARGRVIQRDAEGKPLRHAGTHMDITKRKLAEQELEKHRYQLEELVSERTESIERSLEEKELLLQEIHHRVKNNMQIISSMLFLQSSFAKSKKTTSILKQSQDRIKSMALVHEKIYDAEGLSKINYKNYLETLIESIFLSYKKKEVDIVLETKIEDISLDIDTSIPLGLIVNEMLSNALKHAFEGREQGKVFISLCRVNGDELELIVRDDGIGLPAKFDLDEVQSFGLHIISLLAEQLHGTIELKRDNGTEFTIVFKKAKYRKRLPS